MAIMGLHDNLGLAWQSQDYLTMTHLAAYMAFTRLNGNHILALQPRAQVAITPLHGNYSFAWQPWAYAVIFCWNGK